MSSVVIARWSPDRDTTVAFAAWIAIVAINLVAWLVDATPWRVIWYFGVEALLASIVFPSWYWRVYRGRPLAEIGLTFQRLPFAVAVGVVLAALTVAPRLRGASSLTTAPLLWLVVCLTYSAIFEEVFFRGFLQTRFEAAFGMGPAIVFSGVAFSLYHLGYEPYWRHAQTLILMSVVGIVFAIAFRITCNVITSIIVNAPNAIVAFISRGRGFSKMEAAFSALTILAAMIWLAYLGRSHAESRH